MKYPAQCWNIKPEYYWLFFYSIQLLQNYNSQFLITKYEMNRYFTQHNMWTVKEIVKEWIVPKYEMKIDRNKVPFVLFLC
jgi:hypothetical protein